MSDLSEVLDAIYSPEQEAWHEKVAGLPRYLQNKLDAYDSGKGGLYVGNATDPAVVSSGTP